MVPGCDAQTRHVVVKDGEGERLPSQLGVVCTKQTKEWCEAQNGDVEEVEVLAPVLPGKRW